MQPKLETLTQYSQEEIEHTLLYLQGAVWYSQELTTYPIMIGLYNDLQRVYFQRGEK